MERETAAEAANNEQLSQAGSGADILAIPVWLQATDSFYKKLNRIAKQCGISRYEALRRGLDALLREH
jgi:hypothetical protein